MPNPVAWVDPLGLTSKEVPGVCPDSSQNGTAKIYHYEADEQNPYGHYSVEVSNGTESVHTHQVITAPDQSTTTIVDAVEYSPSKPIEKIVEVNIPNASQALEYQKQQMWQELGPYSQKTNSCVDHVCEVLRQGGEPVKEGALRQYKYLKGLGF